MQNGVCKSPQQIYNFDNLLAKINRRIVENRYANNLIIFVQHCDDELVCDSEPWQLIPELDFLPTDIFINKTHIDSFYHTKLQQILRSQKIDELEICGAQTEYCIDTAIKVAHNKGYNLTMFLGTTSTFDNRFMSAKNTISFYEQIWRDSFLTLKE